MWPNQRLLLTGRMQGGSRALSLALGLRGCRRTPRSRSAIRYMDRRSNYLGWLRVPGRPEHQPTLRLTAALRHNRSCDSPPGLNGLARARASNIAEVANHSLVRSRQRASRFGQQQGSVVTSAPCR